MLTQPSSGTAKSVIATAATPGGLAEILRACPLCSGHSFRRLPTPGHWIGEDIFADGAGTFGLCRCPRCSLVFVNPRPTQARLNSFYASENYVCHSPNAGSVKTAQFLLERVARFGPYQNKRFLDFGCGGGYLLRAALDAGWRARGYDVGKRALASCRAQGLNVTNDLADFRALSFDVVFLNHVFEHLAEPQEVLSKCRRLAGKDGKLVIAVPNLAGMRAQLSLRFLSRHLNVDERHRAFPIHLFYFTPRTLVKTVERNGLRVIAVETFGFGMDEFVNRPEVRVNGFDAKVEPKQTNRRRILRQAVKNIFFSALLGEYLLLVAQST